LKNFSNNMILTTMGCFLIHLLQHCAGSLTSLCSVNRKGHQSSSRTAFTLELVRTPKDSCRSPRLAIVLQQRSPDHAATPLPIVFLILNFICEVSGEKPLRSSFDRCLSCRFWCGRSSSSFFSFKLSWEVEMAQRWCTHGFGAALIVAFLLCIPHLCSAWYVSSCLRGENL